MSMMNWDFNPAALPTEPKEMRPIVRTDKRTGARSTITAESFLRLATVNLDDANAALQRILDREPVETASAIYTLSADWVLTGLVDDGGLVN
jgi:hypothetical protein